jgi:membrane protein
MSRFTKLAPALLTAVAGAVAVRRSQRGWGQVIPATSTPVDHTSRAVLARPTAAPPHSDTVGEPAAPGVDAGPPPKEEEPIPTQTGEGPAHDSPLELPAPDWKASIKRGVKEFKEDRGTLTAAGMAFYWFLSVFPLLAAGAGMLGLLNVSPRTINNITESITGTLPGRAGDLLADAVRKAADASDGAILAVLLGLALALWSASAGCVGMQLGLDVAYDVHDDRPFVKKRLVAFELMLAMLVLGGIATALIVFGAPLGDSLRDNLPFGSAFVVLWTVLRWIGGIAALTGLFATIYFLAPNRDTPRWVWVSPGGILAAVIWLAASLGFSIYVSQFGNYDETYGPMAGVVVLLLWLYLTALAVVLGGELNAELERQSAARKGQVPAQPA